MYIHMYEHRLIVYTTVHACTYMYVWKKSWNFCENFLDTEIGSSTQILLVVYIAISVPLSRMVIVVGSSGGVTSEPGGISTINVSLSSGSLSSGISMSTHMRVDPDMKVTWNVRGL